jgi:lambda repressor-like predicted transcriptional regulator
MSEAFWLGCCNTLAPSKPAGLEDVKAELKRKGWTYRKAAPVLGVNFVHLARVLNAQRRSRALLARIRSLPLNAEARK